MRIIQRNKFNEENVTKYVNFVRFIPTLNRQQLVYLDESHFNPRKLMDRRGWAPRGRVQVDLNRRPLGAQSLSITLLTTIDRNRPNPIFFTSRRSSNSQFDFLEFLLLARRADFLPPGTTIILDNASIHRGAAIQDDLMYFLEMSNLRLIFLPCYSPELNPAELVFSKIKRNLDRSNPILETMIRNAAATVTFDNMDSFYAHSIECRFANDTEAYLQADLLAGNN
jgi:transposase